MTGRSGAAVCCWFCCCCCCCCIKERSCVEPPLFFFFVVANVVVVLFAFWLGARASQCRRPQLLYDWQVAATLGSQSSPFALGPSSTGSEATPPRSRLFFFSFHKGPTISDLTQNDLRKKKVANGQRRRCAHGDSRLFFQPRSCAGGPDAPEGANLRVTTKKSPGRWGRGMFPEKKHRDCAMGWPTGSQTCLACGHHHPPTAIAYHGKTDLWPSGIGWLASVHARQKGARSRPGCKKKRNRAQRPPTNAKEKREKKAFDKKTHATQTNQSNKKWLVQ